MDCCGMAFLLLLGGVLFVVVGVWGATWIELWRFRQAGDEPLETVEAIDAALAEVGGRVAELEKGGSGTWMAGAALRRHRRRLAELQERRQRLIEGLRPWAPPPRESHDVQLPPDRIEPA